MTSPLEQKIKIAGPVVVTANRLKDGAVVYRGRDGGWTTTLHEAAIATAVPEARALLAAAAEDEITAVGAYIAPVEVDGDQVAPGNLRELIRARGPTFALPLAGA